MMIRNRGRRKVQLNGIPILPGETKEIDVTKGEVIKARTTMPGFVVTMVYRVKKKSVPNLTGINLVGVK